MLFDKKVIRPQGVSAKDFEMIEETYHYILSNLYRETPTISFLSQKTNMSPTKFRVLFQKIYGEPIFTYVLNYKLNFAKQLLEAGEASVSQAAYRTGFNHPSSFIRAFKKRFDATPHSFKKFRTEF